MMLLPLLFFFFHSLLAYEIKTKTFFNTFLIKCQRVIMTFDKWNDVITWRCENFSCEIDALFLIYFVLLEQFLCS